MQKEALAGSSDITDLARRSVEHTEDIASAIHARHVATPIADAMLVPVDDPSEKWVEILVDRQFDRAPVIDPDGRINGIVEVEALSVGGSVRDQFRPLFECSMVSADVGLVDVLGFLQDDPFLLVVEGRSISALITPSDLGRPASRTYFYLLLAQLEIALAAWARAKYPDQGEALLELTPSRQAKVRELLADLRQSDSLIDVVAALSVTDLVRIAGRDAECRELWLSGKWSWTGLQDDLGDFRNDVMHPVRGFQEATQEGMRILAERAAQLRHMTDVVQGMLP